MATSRPCPRSALLWCCALAPFAFSCGDDASTAPITGWDAGGGGSGGSVDGAPNDSRGGTDVNPPTDGSVPNPVGLVDWTRAGYDGEIPDVNGNVVDAIGAGALCNGTADDAPALQAAISSAPRPAVLLLPEGTCRIESPLNLESGVVLRGQGSNRSHLECFSQDGCLVIAGSPDGDYVPIQGGLDQGSTSLDVADASGFTVGMGAEIRQEDIVPAAATWGEQAPGQMARVVDIQGNTLTIEPPLHLTYDPTKNPEARPIELVEQVGIEDLHLQRIDAGGSSENNVSIRRAANSWIRRVESDFTEKYHIGISESVHIEIRDSFIHHAKSKGDGGQGYGVSLARYATSILVENNIFQETRHAMIVQIGTSGCVFAYNYAEKNYSDDGWDKTFITLHGHYPFMNLYEGNIVGWIAVDDVWGPAGPGNVFLRNRVLGTDKHQDFGEFRGILLEAYQGTQYVLGNEIAGEDNVYGDLSDAVVHGNSWRGEVTWDPSQPDQTIPTSYYLSAKPAFFGSLAWPAMGGDLTWGEGTIPAWERWSAEEPVPQP